MRNYLGEREYQTWAGWKKAAKEAGAVRLEGDKDIANAFAADGFGVGEWDGEKGTIYERKPRRNPAKKYPHVPELDSGWPDYLNALGEFTQHAVDLYFVETRSNQDVIKSILNVAISLGLLKDNGDGTFEGQLNPSDMENLDPNHIDAFHNYVIGYRLLYYFSERNKREMRVEEIKKLISNSYGEAKNKDSIRWNPSRRRNPISLEDYQP